MGDDVEYKTFVMKTLQAVTKVQSRAMISVSKLPDIYQPWL